MLSIQADDARAVALVEAIHRGDRVLGAFAMDTQSAGEIANAFWNVLERGRVVPRARRIT
jgi:hypothetical protein